MYISTVCSLYTQILFENSWYEFLLIYSSHLFLTDILWYVWPYKYSRPLFFPQLFCLDKLIFHRVTWVCNSHKSKEAIHLYLFQEILVICYVLFKILKEVVTETLKKHSITEAHGCFTACSQRLFEISKFYLKVQCLLS